MIRWIGLSWTASLSLGLVVMQNRKAVKSICILLMMALNISLIQNATAERTGDFTELKILKGIFEQDENQLDLAKIKLSIDKLIDPDIDIELESHRIDQMVADIRSMLQKDAKAMDKMLAIKKYIYTPGTWNNHKAYQYDFSDPLGTKIANKLLPNYMKNKKGNCITMPILFIILGDKLGIDVKASIAPLHVLVKFTDSDGKTYNLETTSGANFARDVWYRKQMPMTDQAIKNGIYLHPLTKKETAAVMITVLAEHYFKEKEYEKSVAISDLSLKFYPNYVNAMLRNGSSFSRLLEKHFISEYPDPNDIPQNQRKLFHFLSAGNRYWFSKAEELGWREPKRDYEEKYLEAVSRDSIKGGI